MSAFTASVRPFLESPNDQMTWSIRVLTIAVVIQLGVAFVLMQFVLGLHTQLATISDVIATAVDQRVAWQDAQTLRTCQLLGNAGASTEAMTQAGCL